MTLTTLRVSFNSRGKWNIWSIILVKLNIYLQSTNLWEACYESLCIYIYFFLILSLDMTVDSLSLSVPHLWLCPANKIWRSWADWHGNGTGAVRGRVLIGASFQVQSPHASAKLYTFNQTTLFPWILQGIRSEHHDCLKHFPISLEWKE